MTYNFDILGIEPVVTFFEYQHQAEQDSQRSKAYLGSPACTLDDFIKSTDWVTAKPNWDWDEVVSTMVQFWFNHEQKITYWKRQLAQAGRDQLLIARITHLGKLRDELEALFDGDSFER